MTEHFYNEVMETAKRMHETYSCFPACSGCPMQGTNIAHCRKVAFENPNQFAELVMGWAKEHQLGINEFSSDQERQIDTVMNAAESLIRALLIKPDYLAGSPLKDYYKTGEELPPIHPSEVADHVADMIVAKLGDIVNVYFPVHIEDEHKDGRIIEHVRDTYDESICNE